MTYSHDRTLYEDALALSINKSLDDVTTLLQWAREEGRVSAKIEQIDRAVALLSQVRENYRAMSESRR